MRKVTSRAAACSRESDRAIYAIASQILRRFELSGKQKGAVRQLAHCLVALSEPLGRERELVDYWLSGMIDHAAGRTTAEGVAVKIGRGATGLIKVFGHYAVRYGAAVRGPRRITIGPSVRSAMRDSRVATQAGTISSPNLSLLTGETFQAGIGRLIVRLRIAGHAVREVTTLAGTKQRKRGRRIDDWLVTLSDGSRIPVEVKCSLRRAYFHKAYPQVANALRERTQALFVGILYSSARIVVVTCDREDDAKTFQQSLRKLDLTA